ncbi:hypothetical protein [Tabrizicola sp.]|jgi:hypothetical protein|uniref:hypothetical protein n=1 Tax=Tabrizicola sp. TaxID=2005166 RepID=UPI001A3741B5|nr:hypothetical protein [Tabrizicola sp.]MBL9064063.1 hypothetical protein [Tabrizicola sp.]
MYGVNLDLLHIAPPCPHAQHRAEHLANLRAARRQRWSSALARLTAWAAPKSQVPVQAPCR